MRSKRGNPPDATIGWREWVSLPDLGVDAIKVKVDTGARSSALHAHDLEEFEKDGERYVRFRIQPVQRSRERSVEAEAKVHEYRSVRSSSGKASLRPVIITPVTLLGETWLIDLTLANRDAMGFRMLLGREAIRHRFLVDPGGSFRGGKPGKKKRKKPPGGTAKKKKKKRTNPSRGQAALGQVE